MPAGPARCGPEIEEVRAIGTVKEIRESYGKLMRVDGVAVMQGLDGDRKVIAEPTPAPVATPKPPPAMSDFTD